MRARTSRRSRVLSQRATVARTMSCFKTGGWMPSNISTGANSTAKLVRLSLIRSHSFSIDTDAGMYKRRN